jgi:short-subunit dehydrogenase
MRKSFSNLVVVITGASSGIGRASAINLAQRGASLVLNARNEAALSETLARCKQAGGTGFVHAADTGDADAVEALCDAAVEKFGRIDVWINNAAVSLFGRFEETPRADFEKVIRTNLLGYANGARAAIRQFREQGHGHLINVSSVVGLVGQPFTSAYTTSKWAILGLTETLRSELADAPGISVSAVLPASIDTPIFQHARNFTGRQIKAMPPVYPASDVAQAVVRLIKKPRREVIVGDAGKAIAALRRLSPALAEAAMRRQVPKEHFGEGRGVPATQGTIHAPGQSDYTESGGWIEYECERQARRAVPVWALWAALAAVFLLTRPTAR